MAPFSRPYTPAEAAATPSKLPSHHIVPRSAHYTTPDEKFLLAFSIAAAGTYPTAHPGTDIEVVSREIAVQMEVVGTRRVLVVLRGLVLRAVRVCCRCAFPQL